MLLVERRIWKTFCLSFCRNQSDLDTVSQRLICWKQLQIEKSSFESKLVHCAILLGHFILSFYWAISLCHFIVPFYWAILLGHFIGPFYWAILLGHFIGPFYWAILLGHFILKVPLLTQDYKRKLANCQGKNDESQ